MDSAGSVTLHGKTINFAGVDKIDPIFDDPNNKIIYGTEFTDRIILENSTNPGEMQVRFVGTRIYNLVNPGFSTGIVFTNPSDSLSIYGLGGGDHIEVKSLDAAFSAELRVYGSRMPLLSGLAQAGAVRQAEQS